MERRLEGTLSFPTPRAFLALFMALALWLAASSAIFGWSDTRSFPAPMVPSCSDHCTQNITWE